MKSIKATSYWIHFDHKGYVQLNALLNNRSYSSIFILVDENSLTHCYPIFSQFVRTHKRIKIIEIKSGEVNKNIETCVSVWNSLTQLGADKRSLLITLGGGVITDLGGFVASTFKRGMEYVNIPTTLLSMVDASVGGKTGIDFKGLKNQIGLFANPAIVIVDKAYLKTLEEKEFLSGKAEMIKYGLINDIKLLEDIQFTEKEDFSELIYRSIEIKNKIVLQDPRESGLRKILNFGHTLGHAIESYFLNSKERTSLTHGEAIAIGMVCESYLSHRVLDFSKQKAIKVKNLIGSIYRKVSIEAKDYEPIIDLLKHDKKNRRGKINFVLLYDFGEFKLNCEIDHKLLVESVEFYNH